MGVFGGHQRPKEAPPKIRVERVVVPAPPSRRGPVAAAARSSMSRLSSPRPATTTSSASKLTTRTASSTPAERSLSRTSKSASPLLSSPSADELGAVPRRNYTHVSPTSSTASLTSTTAVAVVSRKRKAHPAVAPRKAATPPLGRGSRIDFGADSDSDAHDDADEEDWIGVFKKRRRARWVDTKRKLRHARAFKNIDASAGARYRFIHAQQVASLAKGCKALFNATEAEVGIEVQYPSLLPREKFELVTGKDMIDAVDTSIQIVRFVADTYLPPDKAVALTDPRTGIIRRLEKASNRNVENMVDFKAALHEYNELLESLVRSGAVSRVLDTRIELLPPELVAFILEQVYDRTVAPEVDKLAKYENGSDNVYGELLHPLVTRILVEELGMRSDMVFVDLGSGVGNVVLQAALEIGCESWGCEMMDNACDLAEKQHAEFAARCMLWGIKPGRVALERGDFRTNENIHKALQRADAVLVNNQAFTSQLNDALVSMFLDLKPGCKIVSLKSFVRSSAHNINDVASTILDVQDLTYPESGQVSWTNAGGSFCISTRR